MNAAWLLLGLLATGAAEAEGDLIRYG